MGTLTKEDFHLHLNNQQDNNPPTGTIQDLYAPTGEIYSNNPSQWKIKCITSASDSGSGIKYFLIDTNRVPLVNDYTIGMSVNNLSTGDFCAFSITDGIRAVPTSHLRLKRITGSSPFATTAPLAQGYNLINYTFGSPGEYLVEARTFDSEPYRYARFFTVTDMGIPSDPGLTLSGGVTPASLTINRPSAISAGADVVFVVDVSGSYGDDLTTFNDKADQILDAFAAFGNDSRYGLISYCDTAAEGGAYTHQLDQQLTSSRSDFKTQLSGLVAGGGGDEPEAQLDGLYYGTTNINWRSGTLRMMFLVTDATYHDPGPGLGKTTQEVIDACNTKKIAVFGLNTSTGLLNNIPADTGGADYTLSSDSSEIVSTIESSLVHMTNNTIVKPQTNLFITGYSPASVPMSSIPVGGTYTFQAQINTALIASLGYTGTIMSEVLLQNDDGIDMVKIPVIFA